MNSSKSHSFLGFRKLPPKYNGIVMPFFLSVLMTCIVSMISTLRGVGWGGDFLKVWPGSWGISWLIAFPVLLLVLPLVRRLTARVVRSA
ncbi:DUF2798 domain-containing protein [Chitinimonas sp. PSY-7]|uniref:DUF2798 domain-containing protein n=1 Tax=Chitinimonas sp. PSY-7 TaxID=3459088 RepID=UPI00403FF6A8